MLGIHGAANMPLYLQNEHVLAGTDLAKVSASAIVIVIFQHAKIETWPMLRGIIKMKNGHGVF